MHETWFADRVPQSPPDERLPNQGVRLRVRVRVRVCVRVRVRARVRARVRVHVHVHSRPRECRCTVQHLLQAQCCVQAQSPDAARAAARTRM